MNVEESQLEHIFLRDREEAVEKLSARGLRNRIVHRLQKGALIEVENRKKRLMKDMRSFISEVQKAAQISEGF